MAYRGDQSTSLVHRPHDSKRRGITTDLVRRPSAWSDDSSQTGWVNGIEGECDRGRVAVLPSEGTCLRCDERRIVASRLEPQLRIPDLEILVVISDQDRDAWERHWDIVEKVRCSSFVSRNEIIHSLLTCSIMHIWNSQIMKFMRCISMENYASEAAYLRRPLSVLCRAHIAANQHRVWSRLTNPAPERENLADDSFHMRRGDPIR